MENMNYREFYQQRLKEYDILPIIWLVNSESVGSVVLESDEYLISYVATINYFQVCDDIVMRKFVIQGVRFYES